MNKKAQASALAFMLAVVVIILGLAWISPVNEMTKLAMNETSEIGGMNCTSSALDDFTKAGCWTLDIAQVYFIGGIIALAGVIIAARIIFGD